MGRVMSTQEEIKKLFKTLKPYDARELANWLQKEYDYSFNWYSVEVTDAIQKIADRIFELCPNANCIPIAYCNVDYNDWYVKYDDYGLVLDYAQEYLMDKKEWGYQMPYFDDEMKKKEWDEIDRLMVTLHELVGGEDTHDKGDYCEYSHPSFIIFDREENDIIQTEEFR